MRKIATQKWLVCFMILVVFAGCSSTTKCTDFSGVTTPDGKAIAHLSTSNVALHFLLGKSPLKGDASLEKTVADFTAAAKAEGASKVRIVQSRRTNWWFVFFPFSLLITPVTSNVAGDAIE